MMDKIRPWRVNYVVSYRGIPARLLFQERALAVLKNVAWLNEIDCKVSSGHVFVGTYAPSPSESSRAQLSDLVYFRSTAQTRIRGKEFRALVDAIFADHPGALWESNLSVLSQAQSALRDFPFPKN